MSRVESAQGEPLRLIAGLGNPGRRYVGTRHNVGFRVVETLAARRSTRFDREECNALVASGESLLIAKPLTYMNRSGYALRCLLERHDLRPENVLVIYDEVHLPLARLRLRRGGEPAGHRGMESIVRNLRTIEVPRLRVGVGPEDVDLPSAELSDYVLERFSNAETAVVNEMVERAADAAETWLDEGVDQAMNLFNRPVAAAD